MNCWYCGKPLVWQSDYNFDEVMGRCMACTKDECDGIATVLVCSHCRSTVNYYRLCDEELEREAGIESRI